MSDSPEPTPPPELAAAENTAPRLTGLSTVWMILGVIAIVGVGLALAIFSLGYYSSKRFAERSREAEGKMALGQLSKRIQECAEERGDLGDGSEALTLPDSAPPVPASLGLVAGKAYQSATSDWAHPTYTCAKFQVFDPQRYQIEWVRASPNAGTVRVRNDDDGDGKPDVTFEIDVRCGVEPGNTRATCSRGPVVREIR